MIVRACRLSSKVAIARLELLTGVLRTPFPKKAFARHQPTLSCPSFDAGQPASLIGGGWVFTMGLLAPRHPNRAQVHAANCAIDSSSQKDRQTAALPAPRSRLHLECRGYPASFNIITVMPPAIVVGIIATMKRAPFVAAHVAVSR